MGNANQIGEYKEEDARMQERRKIGPWPHGPVAVNRGVKTVKREGAVARSTLGSILN